MFLAQLGLILARAVGGAKMSSEKGQKTYSQPRTSTLRWLTSAMQKL